MNFMTDIQKQLFGMKDEKYRLFQCSLMPTVDPETVIGVRAPVLRKTAASLCADHPEKTESFLRELPHKYYEENNLHAFIIEKIKDPHAAIKAIGDFLPYVDNWATCDCMFPKALKRAPEEALKFAKRCIASKKCYTVRYGVGILMHMFLDDKFSPEYLALAASAQSGEYYVDMMVAWYFATALAKQYDHAVKYIEHRELTDFVHKKSIQKARESFRVSDDKKAYLKTLI